MLPATGPLGLDQVVAELGQPARTQTTFNDAAVRSLAVKPSGMIAASDLRGKSSGTPVALAYVGVSNIGVATAAVLQAMPSYALPTLPWRFNLTAGVGQFMYWATPKTFGAVQFFDTESLFMGGWDGAHNDWGSTTGPVKVVIDGVDYLVYRTDYYNLGFVPWEARVDSNPPYPIP